MVNPDLRELLKNHSRRYSLVMATAKRARQIVDETNDKNEILIEKPVSLAINELQDGSLTFTEPEILDDTFDNLEFGKKADESADNAGDEDAAEPENGETSDTDDADAPEEQ